jgi:hypothetical protein
MLAELPEEERRVLDALVAGPPIGRSRSAADPSSPVGRLLGRGLLIRVDSETVELPQQVGIALRGERPMGVISATPPVPETRQWPARQVDATAGGAALELLRRVERLIERWGAAPPPVLRSGGLGVRDLRRTARELETDEAGAALIVELALAADLIGEDDAPNAGWMPTTAADIWSAGGPEQRWTALARAWLDLPRLPGLVGLRDDQDRPINALAEVLRRPLAPRDRRRVLEALAGLPPGTAVRRPEDLAELLAWTAPRRGGRLRDEIVRWTLAEGTVLGIVALDAVSEPGRVLLSTPDTAPVVAALRAVLPEPVETVLLQADLTAVAPGPLVPWLARELRLMADVESAGGATVYRFTENSVRRALDAGRSAGELADLLAERSSTPVPQALTYLIEDVGRRHGRLRGGVASAFLRSDDEVLLSEVLANPEVRGVGLRRIAPTVAVSEAPLAELLDVLRAAGFSPAAEDAAGGVLDLGPAPTLVARAPGWPCPSPPGSGSTPSSPRCGRGTRSSPPAGAPGSGSAPPTPSPPSSRPRGRASRCGSATWTGTACRASGCSPRRPWVAASWRAGTPWTGRSTGCPSTGSRGSRWWTAPSGPPSAPPWRAGPARSGPASWTRAAGRRR